jgi:CO/xanthine dehydrogenase Mo-binding subunit
VPVAAVVAESAVLARDAAELIEVDYEPLPPIADPERGLEPGAALAHPSWDQPSVQLAAQGATSTARSAGRRTS